LLQVSCRSGGVGNGCRFIKKELALIAECTEGQFKLCTFSSRPDVMNNPGTQNERIAKMTFASVYPLYLAKIEKKGRTRAELDQVIKWLTGFDDSKLKELIETKATFGSFFGAASLNPNARLITGVICGYRIEEIEDPLTRQVRYLDKLVDELAKGRKMEKILRG
jgi:hypothetical protein